MSNIKHVLFILENAPVPIDKRVWQEALAVKEMGYNVSILSPKDKRAPKKYEMIEGIHIYRHPLPFEGENAIGYLLEYSIALFWQIILSFKIYFKDRFQVIHTANPPDHIFVVTMLFKLFGVKYIFDHHDASSELYMAKFNRKDLFYRMVRMIEKINFLIADVVISTNESYKKIAVQRGKKNNSQVFVVRNGIDLSRLNTTSNGKVRYDGFDYLVAYVGIIGKQEGIDHLLQVIEHIVFKKEIRNIKFIVMGSGTHLAAIQDLSKTMKVDRYIDFAGFVPYNELIGILSGVDVCVNPELKNPYSDISTMMKIMDYMVVGKPVVQFDLTENQFTAGDSALCVEENDIVAFADAVVDLIHDKKRRVQMGEVGKKRISEMLHWGIQKNNLIKAYQYCANLK